MDCIYCGKETRVTNSRPQRADHQTWRRRQCTSCRATLTSIERIKLDEALRVQKRGRSIEPFLRDKLFLSIYQSVSHLKNPIDTAHQLTNTVLRHILKEISGPTISTDKIAILTTQVLKRYNAAAAVRYLSFQKQMPRPSDINRSLK